MSPRALLPLAATAITFTLAAGALGQAAAPKLQGTVGPGFTIHLSKTGQRVTSLGAGSYRFVISDRSGIHNFTLEQEKGGTFEKALTSTPFEGTKTVQVTLKKGRWKYYCSVHESMMFGFFTVK